MVYLKVDEPKGDRVQVAFSVPKRNFPLACDRNRVKRQMREAYRLHKEYLYNNIEGNYAIMFICVGRVKMKYEKLDRAMKEVLSRLK